MARPLALGTARTKGVEEPFLLPTHNLVTHGVIVGMTGSGKTGLLMGLVEEALRSQIPALLIDIKGDLPNLGLLFGELSSAQYLPWIDEDRALREGSTKEKEAEKTAETWTAGLAKFGLQASDVEALRTGIKLRIITPGAKAVGEPLDVLSPLEAPADPDADEESVSDALAGAVSLLLRMVKREADPTSREHALLSHLVISRRQASSRATLETLIADLKKPPISTIGALPLEEFFPSKERAGLAQDLNALVASPTFASWRMGAPLDVKSWMQRTDTRTPVTILSVAHLDDEERQMVLGLVLEQTLTWVRGLSGTSDLRALLAFDEVFGFLPPHPANPPTKRPLLALLKQARAFGVGCILATQNPVDLDYKAISNAGVWFIGRLQTDTDRERLVEGIAGSDAGTGEGVSREDLKQLIKELPQRTFLVRNAQRGGEAAPLLSTRFTLSWLRGPMTRAEIKLLSKALDPNAASGASATAATSTEAQTSTAVAFAASVAPQAGNTVLPEAPTGWRSLFPHPPAAPVGAWGYFPHLAVIATATLSDRKYALDFEREIAVVVPFDQTGPVFGEARALGSPALSHDAVPGATFAPIPNMTKADQKSFEKALKERATDELSLTLFVHEDEKIASSPGESRDAFVARCQQHIAASYGAERQTILDKHEPKIRKLQQTKNVVSSSGVDPNLLGVGVAILSGHMGTAIRRGSQAAARAKREEEKRQKADIVLAEAIAKRDAELADLDRDAKGSFTGITELKLRPKAGALRIETFGIAWLAR